MALLDSLSPMELDERPIDLKQPGWLYEIKFDGWRPMAEFGDGACLLRTRRGADATRWFPEVSKSLAAVPDGPYVIDGEVCVLDARLRARLGPQHACRPFDFSPLSRVH